MDALVFNEDAQRRTFMSSDFNFLLDKETGVSMSWGKTTKDNPKYDPLSPEKFIIRFTKNTDYNNVQRALDILCNLRNKDEKGNLCLFTSFEQFEYVALTTLSTVVFDISKIDLKDLDIIKFKDLINFCKKISIMVIVAINGNYNYTLQDVMKLKVFDSSICFMIEKEFSLNQLYNNIMLFVEKELWTFASIILSNDMLKTMIKEDFSIIPKNFCMNFFISNQRINEELFEELQKVVLNNGLVNSSCIYDFKNTKYKEILASELNEDKAFNLYFKDDAFYKTCKYSSKDKTPLENVKNINDVWKF